MHSSVDPIEFYEIITIHDPTGATSPCTNSSNTNQQKSFILIIFNSEKKHKVCNFTRRNTIQKSELKRLDINDNFCAHLDISILKVH